MLLGDFNISWNAKSNAEKLNKRKLITLANSHDLEQIIDQPTRVTETSSSIIDLIFSNTCHRVVEHGVIDLSLSDHSMVYCIVKAGVIKTPGKTIEYRSYKRYQKCAFIQDLSQVDWNVVNDEPNVDRAVLMWNEMFLCSANRHAPIKRTRIKGTKLPWMTVQLKDAIQKRDYYHRKAKQCNSARFWALYKKARNFVNAEVKKCKAEYYYNVIKENKKNSTALWKTLNEVTSRKQNGPIACIESDGVVYTDHKTIATIFNHFFSSIAVILTEKLKAVVDIYKPPNLQHISTPTTLFHFKPITEQFVVKELMRLKTNKSIGLDKISARLLKDSAYLRKSYNSIQPFT